MAVGRVFRFSGSTGAGGGIAMTPPAGELWIVKGDGISFVPGSTWSHLGTSTDATQDFGPFAPSPQTQKIWLPVTPAAPMSFKNTNASSSPYFFSGDITTLAAEGISAVKRNTVTDAIADVDLYTLTAGTAAYVALNTKNGSNLMYLVDTAANATLINLSTYYPGYARFWLWSALPVKIRLVGTTTTDALVVVAEYDEATLEEYTNRIHVYQSLAAAGTYTLRPPTDEIWYVDLHSWHGNNLRLQWNGAGTDTSTAANPRSQFRLSNDNYVVFQNNTAAAATLLITGTKAKA